MQRGAVAHRVGVANKIDAARLFGHQHIHRAVPVVVHCRHAAGGTALAAAEGRLCPVAGIADVGIKIRLPGLGDTGDIHQAVMVPVHRHAKLAGIGGCRCAHRHRATQYAVGVE